MQRRNRPFYIGALAAALAATGIFGQAGLGLLSERKEIAIPGEPSAIAPIPSPDGRYLAFTAEGFKGLKLLDLKSSKVITLSEAPAAGFRPEWSPDGSSIAFRSSTGGERPLLRIVVAHPDGVTETASPLARDLSLPFWSGETLLFWTSLEGRPAIKQAGPRLQDGQANQFVAATPDGRLWYQANGAVPEPSSSSGRVFFLPRLSPDGGTFVTECLDGHLYLGRTSGGALQDLGPGSSPSFVRDGRALLFERTKDDGHEITASDIFLMDLETKRTAAITDTPNRIERRPAMAADGHTLFFDEGGNIFSGWVP